MAPRMQLREDQSQALKAEVKSLIEKGAVVPVSESQIHLTSPLFVVPKSGGGWRPIIDLRRLNQYLRPPHFKMEGLHMLPNVVRQNFFMAKVDLKDAYLTVPVSAEFHCLLGFQDDNGQLLQFQTLPFGLCTAPYAFSKITKPAVQFLRQAGIHIIIYLDDMLLVSPTESSLAQDLSTVLWLFSSLGFLINIPKTTVVPSSEIEFLGFTVNTKTMTVALPTIKRSGIQLEVARVLQNKTICLKVLPQLLGKLVATKPAVFRAPLHYRALQHLKISRMRAGQEVATIPPKADKDLTWWHTQLPMHPCSPIVQKEASVVIESDASLKGWGANCEGVRTSGVWNVSEAQYHINLLELRAAYLAIQCFLKGRSGVNVLLRLDNRTAIAYLNHMGGASMTPLCCLALEIWEWCLARDIVIRAEYLPGVENVAADWESCHHNDSSNWQLSPAVFDAVSQLIGPFSLDLFASRINHQLPIYCSWRPDPGVISVDAFTMSWRDQSPYLFPPFCLYGKALLKIQRESVNQACLIAPAWPGQMWYSQLLTMLAGYPILLPQFPELLLSPDQKPHPLVLEEKLFLTAWPVSGDVTKCKAFQRGLRSSSCSPGEITPIPLTIQPGVSGIAGVLNETIVPLQHL